LAASPHPTSPVNGNGGWSQSALDHPRGMIPRKGSRLATRVGATPSTNPHCPTCNPPLLFSLGRPVMGTPSSIPGHVTITPFYWAPAGYVYTTNYKAIINGYIADVAAASQTNTNVFSVSTQYYEQLSSSSPVQHIEYVVKAGGEVDDPTPFPAQNLSPGCVADSGFTDCVTDGALTAELQARLGALALPIDDSHLYMVFFPQGVETCSGPGKAGPGTAGTACSTNVYCAYHSTKFGLNPLIYANEPFPDPTGCSSGESPNGDPAADAQISITSHEANESITDAGGAWIDSTGFENGDQCAFTFGLPLGSTGGAGTAYNQVIGTGHYYTQDEFSNEDYALGVGDVTQSGGPKVAGCVQREELPTASFTGPASVMAGTACAVFDGSTSSDSDNAGALIYSWNWGDGTANGTGAAPSHIFASPGTFTVTLTVTDVDGWSASIAHSVMVTASASPTVSGVAPNSGSTAGGTPVTITGTNLSCATFVSFGSATASFSVNSATQIMAISPPGSGTVDVTVVTAAGTSATSTTDQFTYVLLGDVYTAVTPVRLLDTRLGGTLGSGSSLNLAIGGHMFGSQMVPANASAVILNVTTTNGSTAGFFTVYPTGVTRPLASNLNWAARETVPNLVSVGLGAGGAITIYNGVGSADAVVDLEGYYTPPGGSTAGELVAVVPARITDTRAGSGQANAGMTLGADAKLDVQVTGAGGIPSGVSAVVMNVTATSTSAAGFFTVFPTGVTRPLASNLNWAAGVTVPNRVIVPVGTGGKVSFYNGVGSADLIVDVGGYFTGNSSSGATFLPLTPTRIVDTRFGTGGFNTPLGQGAPMVVTVAGSGGVPNMAAAIPPTAVVLNVTVTGATAASDLAVWPHGGSRPVASDLNFAAGQTVPNLVIVKLSSAGKIDIGNDFGSTDVIVDVVGWYG